MSRIRSVHPGFFRDENLVPCSSFARLLYIGLGIEADDKGIFEWKPVQLKMTIFPADSVDVAALLAELVAAGNVRRFEFGGKAFGAIRNFRKYQRPKTPNSVHPMPDDIAEYVAFPRKGETPGAEPEPFPPEGEKSPQMEDGGGRMEEETKTLPPAIVAEASKARAIVDEIFEAFPRNPSSNDGKAERVIAAMGAADQRDLLKAAKRYRTWFEAECIARERTEDAGLRFVPHLATWIQSGAWKEADALPVKGEVSADLVVIVAGGPEFEAVQKLRSKPIFVNDSGRATITKSELERAMAVTH